MKLILVILSVLAVTYAIPLASYPRAINYEVPEGQAESVPEVYEITKNYDKEESLESEIESYDYPPIVESYYENSPEIYSSSKLDPPHSTIPSITIQLAQGKQAPLPTKSVPVFTGNENIKKSSKQQFVPFNYHHIPDQINSSKKLVMPHSTIPSNSAQLVQGKVAPLKDKSSPEIPEVSRNEHKEESSKPATESFNYDPILQTDFDNSPEINFSRKFVMPYPNIQHAQGKLSSVPTENVPEVARNEDIKELSKQKFVPFDYHDIPAINSSKKIVNSAQLVQGKAAPLKGKSSPEIPEVSRNEHKEESSKPATESFNYDPILQTDFDNSPEINSSRKFVMPYPNIQHAQGKVSSVPTENVPEVSRNEDIKELSKQKFVPFDYHDIPAINSSKKMVNSAQLLQGKAAPLKGKSSPEIPEVSRNEHKKESSKPATESFNYDPILQTDFDNSPEINSSRKFVMPYPNIQHAQGKVSSVPTENVPEVARNEDIKELSKQKFVPFDYHDIPAINSSKKMVMSHSTIPSNSVQVTQSTVMPLPVESVPEVLKVTKNENKEESSKPAAQPFNYHSIRILPTDFDDSIEIYSSRKLVMPHPTLPSASVYLAERKLAVQPTKNIQSIQVSQVAVNKDHEESSKFLPFDYHLIHQLQSNHDEVSENLSSRELVDPHPTIPSNSVQLAEGTVAPSPAESDPKVPKVARNENKEESTFVPFDYYRIYQLKSDYDELLENLSSKKLVMPHSTLPSNFVQLSQGRVAPLPAESVPEVPKVAKNEDKEESSKPATKFFKYHHYDNLPKKLVVPHPTTPSASVHLAQGKPAGVPTDGDPEVPEISVNKDKEKSSKHQYVPFDYHRIHHLQNDYEEVYSEIFPEKSKSIGPDPTIPSISVQPAQARVVAVPAENIPKVPEVSKDKEESSEPSTDGSFSYHPIPILQTGYDNSPEIYSSKKLAVPHPTFSSAFVQLTQNKLTTVPAESVAEVAVNKNKEESSKHQFVPFDYHHIHQQQSDHDASSEILTSRKLMVSHPTIPSNYVRLAKNRVTPSPAESFPEATINEDKEESSKPAPDEFFNYQNIRIQQTDYNNNAEIYASRKLSHSTIPSSVQHTQDIVATLSTESVPKITEVTIKEDKEKSSKAAHDIEDFNNYELVSTTPSVTVTTLSVPNVTPGLEHIYHNHSSTSESQR